VRANSSFGRGTAVDSGAAEGWKAQIDAGHRALIEERLSQEMALAGYPVSNPATLARQQY
jgi:hypothetical protein